MLNGSRLGKELSANAITDRLEKPKQVQVVAHEEPTLSQIDNQQSDDSVMSLFDMESHGPDLGDEEFARLMKRKKKKKQIKL